MTNMKNWVQPEVTTKEIYEGFYPVVIAMSKLFDKKMEKDGVVTVRQTLALTFKTLQEVPFPDKTQGKIVVEQEYYFDTSFHMNAVNGIARASGIPNFQDSNDFEAKTLMIGMINRHYESRDGEAKTIAQMGTGLFSYAPLCENSQVEFAATDHPEGYNEDKLKGWFKTTVAKYKTPK